MRVLIIGGTGFVGKHLLDAVMLDPRSEKVDNVIVACRSPHLTQHDVETIVWDVTRDELPLVHVDVVIHAATPASASLNARFPQIVFDQILIGARQVLKFCASQPRAPLLIFASSGAVYGEMPPEVTAWPEGARLAADPLIARNAYASAKRSAEALIGIGWNEGVCRPVVARLFAFSGRHLPLDRHYALGNFVADAVRSQTIRVRSAGTSVRSYLDGDDMARWLLASIHKPEAVGKILHIGSEEPITIKELANVVARRVDKVTGRRPLVTIENSTNEIDGLSRYVPHTQFTRELLGVEPEIPLETSIDSMLENAQKTMSERKFDRAT